MSDTDKSRNLPTVAEKVVVDIKSDSTATENIHSDLIFECTSVNKCKESFSHVLSKESIGIPHVAG